MTILKVQIDLSEILAMLSRPPWTISYRLADHRMLSPPPHLSFLDSNAKSSGTSASVGSGVFDSDVTTVL